MCVCYSLCVCVLGLTNDSEKEGSVVRAMFVGEDAVIVGGLTLTHIPYQQRTIGREYTARQRV